MPCLTHYVMYINGLQMAQVWNNIARKRPTLYVCHVIMSQPVSLRRSYYTINEECFGAGKVRAVREQ